MRPDSRFERGGRSLSWRDQHGDFDDRCQIAPGFRLSDPASARPLLAGQKAIVTGASSGIGRAIALAFARAGCDVLVNYQSGVNEAAAVAAEAGSLGVTAFAHKADVSEEADVEGMFERARLAFGRVDILVANAGMQADAPTADMTMTQWHRVIETNLTGQFLCMRAAIRQFARQAHDRKRSAAAGKIVCISSVHDVIPWSGHVNYAASKGGVGMLMRSIAQEVAGSGVRVNAISPGAIRTPINREAWETEGALRKLLTLIPYGRIGEPEDVARAAVWLASDEADYVVGATIYVDGGMTLSPGFAGNG